LKKKKRKNRKSRFHIIPKARGGNDTRNNVSSVDIKKHQLYHQLFGIQTPDEIINDLVNNYWNKNWEWIKKSLKEVEDV